MEPVLYIVAAALLAVLLLFAARIRGRAEQADRDHQQDVAVAAAARLRVQPEERGEGMPRRRRNVNRMMAQRRAQHMEEEIEAAEDDDDDESAEAQASGKIGAKKQKKLEEKQARKAQREAEEAERGERKKLEVKREEERRKEEEQVRLEEERKEEEERKAKEEEEKRDHDEYLKLKQGFVVEEEGLQESMSEEQSRSFLSEFINFVKTSKVVILEDLGANFGLRAQVLALSVYREAAGKKGVNLYILEAISRIQDLLADGSITGVIDDRGKFIYITPEELASVAQFVRQRGRVSISDLAHASNSLINLNPDTSAVPLEVS